MEERPRSTGVCLASFCFLLPGQEHYEASCEELAFALHHYGMVVLHISFDAQEVPFAAYQSFLTHVYTTLAEQNSLCEVVIVDPSIPLRRVATSEPWCSLITAVTPSVLSALDGVSRSSWVVASCKAHAQLKYDTAHIEPRLVKCMLCLWIGQLTEDYKGPRGERRDL
jgi:hypothetical protein